MVVERLDVGRQKCRRGMYSFGIAKECHRRIIASWDCRWQRRSPINFSWFVLFRRHSFTELASPRGEPRMVAWLGLTNGRSGNGDSSESADVWLWLMNSDFSTFNYM